MTVRVNTGALPLQTIRGKPLDLLSVVPSLKRVGMVGEWPARIETPQGETVAGRVCAVRKTQEATRMAQKRLQKAAAKTGKPLPFPPGDTTWRQLRPHSPWRDFHFLLNQVKNTIDPHIPLTRIVSEWNHISHALAEPPRRRTPQLARYFSY